MKLFYNRVTDMYVGKGYNMQREHGETPSGGQISGRWVLREVSGRFLDYDRDRQALAERYDLKLVDQNG